MRKVRTAMPIEYAATFDDAKFDALMVDVEETAVPASHVLVYHYTSMKAAKVMAKMGIPAYRNKIMLGDGNDESEMGIIFSLKGPNLVKKGNACARAFV